jgi:hypothetical protein
LYKGRTSKKTLPKMDGPDINMLIDESNKNSYLSQSSLLWSRIYENKKQVHILWVCKYTQVYTYITRYKEFALEPLLINIEFPLSWESCTYFGYFCLFSDSLGLLCAPPYSWHAFVLVDPLITISRNLWASFYVLPQKRQSINRV